MPFPSDRVGLHLEPHESEVTARKILAYAAGLGASEPEFLDDAQSGGLRALPFQCVSPEWPVLLSMRHILGDALPPDEARRGVHAIQDSTFHRPMRAGDRLVTDGQLISASTLRSGVLTVCRLTTREKNSGDLVTTTLTSSIYRDVQLVGDPISLEPITGLAASDTAPLSHNAQTLSFIVPREMPHVYSECADIWNPIHTERAVALAAGLPDIILHGTATWALAGLAILRAHGGRDVARLKRMTGRFSGMIIPGEAITIRYEMANGGPVRFEVRNAAGTPAISQGVAWL